MKLTIEKITRYDKNKDGLPLVNKQGKPYIRLSVTAGGKTYSAFGGQWNDKWKVGDTIEADVVANGQYFNIVAPKPMDKLEGRIVELEKQVALLAKMIQAKNFMSASELEDTDEEPPMISDDDLPF